MTEISPFMAPAAELGRRWLLSPSITVTVPFEVWIDHKPPLASEVIRGAFAHVEWSTFTRFSEYAKELDESEYVRAGMPLKVEIRWTSDGGVEAPGELPPSSQIREFLHLLRPFVLESEDTYFLKVTGALGKHVQHPWFQKNLKSLKQTFLGQVSQQYFTLSSDDFVLNSERALQMWLNAFEYHREPAKRERLQQLHQVLPLDVSKGLFIDLLRYKVEAIWWVAGLITKLEASPTHSVHTGPAY